MATGDRRDPFLQYNFLVEIDGVANAGFSEVSGVDSSTEVVEYRVGSSPIATPVKLPGMYSHSNIMLKRGWTNDYDLWNWRKTTLDGLTERRAFSVIVLNEAREEALRFNFVEAWICKWEGPAMNATTNEAAIESIEICHEGVETVT